MKELVKLIKKTAKRHSLEWMRDDEYEYLRMHGIAIKTQLLEPEELGALVSYFGRIPQSGEAVSYHNAVGKEILNHVQQMQMIESVKEYFEDGFEEHIELEDTKLSVFERMEELHIFKMENRFVYVKKDYMNILKDLFAVSDYKAKCFLDEESRTLELIAFFFKVEEDNPFLRRL